MHPRQRNLLLLTSILLMLILNGLASATAHLGFALKDLYQFFPFAFMPPAWAFMLSRGLIHSLGIGFFITYCMHHTKNKNSDHFSQDFFPYYISILLLNIAWIITTTQRLWILSIIIITAMLITLYLILRKISKQTGMIKYLGNAARGIYMGWINIATIVLGVSQVVYSLGYTSISTSFSRMIALSIGVGAVAGISFYQLKNWYMLGRSVFALGAAWLAFLG
ncbi:MAG: hypothetical protein Q4B28_02695 [bacterium]|nr:hypothetical protein [bacterium]